jgi:hypothetical protein
MIVRSGTAASLLIEFPSGAPDGNISWSVINESGVPLATGTLTPAVGAVSTYLNIPAVHNTLSGSVLSGFRDVAWSYTSGGVTINDERRYTVEARIPFGVTYEGVRQKLGVDHLDLPNNEIDLVGAYYRFEELTGVTILAADDRAMRLIRDAIEALAALQVIPTMVTRVNLKEASGTDSIQRDKQDWQALAAQLQGYVDAGILILVPTYDPFAAAGELFVLAPPSDNPFPE